MCLQHLAGHLNWYRCHKHVLFAIQVEVAAAGDDKSAAAKVEQELLQVRKKKGGLKVGAWFSVLCAEYRSSCACIF